MTPWGYKITLHVYVEGPHDEKLIETLIEAVPVDYFAVVAVEDIDEEPKDQIGT